MPKKGEKTQKRNYQNMGIFAVILLIRLVQRLKGT